MGHKTFHYRLLHVSVTDIQDELRDLLPDDEDDDDVEPEQLTNMRKTKLAQQFMQAAHDLLQEVVADTGDENAQAYLVDHLRILSTEGHGFLSRDMTVDTLIRRLEEKEEECTTQQENS